jgi:hypothetical protein
MQERLAAVRRAEGAREIDRPEGQPVRRLCQLAGIRQAPRRLDQRDQRGTLRQGLPNRRERAAGLRLRQHRPVDRKRAQRVEITLEMRAVRAVDPHQHRRPAGAIHPVVAQRLAQRPSGGFLAVRRHRILQIDDDGVSA